MYTITPTGKEIFKELMTKFSLAETRVFLDFNAVIVNMALIDEECANECIANIKNSIQNTKMQIMEQQFLLLETLEKWEENFEKEFEEAIGDFPNWMYEHKCCRII